MDTRLPSGTNMRFRLAPLVVLAVGLLTYINSLYGVFIFDDISGILKDVGTRSFFPAIRNTSRAVVGLTFYLNYELGGFRAADYHAVNITIHVGAALLLFGIVRRTLSLSVLKSRFGESAPALACVVACVWAVHPLQTESVTYISQRAESLMGLFYFMTLYCFIRGSELENNSRWFTASIAACALGMAVKPVMVTAPIMVALYDRFFLSGALHSIPRSRRAAHLGLIATWLVPIMLLSVHFVGLRLIGQATEQPSTGFAYLLAQQGVVVHYLKLTFWPRLLCLDYGWPLVTAIRESLVPASINAVLVLLTLWLIRRRSPLGFCGLWFFVTLAPTSSVFPLADVAAEHRMYVPLAGIVSCVIPAVHEALKRFVRPGVLIGLAGFVILALAARTFERNRDYQSEEAMWRSVVEVSPMNLRARNDYAVALSETGLIQEAISQYQTVLSMIPAEDRRRFDGGGYAARGPLMPNSSEYNYFRAHVNMGLLCHKEIRDPEKAVSHYAAALRVVPWQADAREKMKAALRAMGVQDKDLAAAVEQALRTGMAQ